MTIRLTAALKSYQHLRSARVFCLANGTAITRDHVIKAIRGAQRRAELSQSGVHILRHTFCSHLAMRGAPACAIQELAGHADLTTTQRYTHLSPAPSEEEGCSTVDRPVWSFTKIVETFWRRGGWSAKDLTEKELVERATGIEPV